MKIEISTFDEETENYEHYGYYDSISEAISTLTQMYIYENFTEEQIKEIFCAGNEDLIWNKEENE
jgi:hypothetical protein